MAGDDLLMEGGLNIQTTAEADARCIADELGEYGPTVNADDDLVVSFAGAVPDYTVLLAALRACLDRHAIASVQVTLDEHSYLMEGSRASDR